MKKILVGLSGGVDSAVSAYLLTEQGYDVTAGFMINYLAPEGEHCPTKEDLAEAKKVAEFLGIPFFTFDYREEYSQKVLDYLYEGYQKGITPNPDIMCNSEVKFKVFLDEALQHGFDGVAMGHYAQIEEKNISFLEKEEVEHVSGKNTPPSLPLVKGGIDTVFFLKKGVDPKKDQSYFLAGLNQFQLSKALFPIGHLQKSQVREIAEKIGLPNAKRKDSQGICFVGKVDMHDFLEKKIQPKPGVVKDTAGNILGEHKGVFYYTIGQRKGLDIGGQAEPIFVVRKNIERNEIIVGTSSDLDLYADELTLKNIHFLSPHPTPLPEGEGIASNGKRITFPFVGKAKIRYRQADQECEVFTIPHPTPLPEGEGIATKYKVKFSEKQRAITSGQIFALYDENDYLVASGVID